MNKGQNWIIYVPTKNLCYMATKSVQTFMLNFRNKYWFHQVLFDLDTCFKDICSLNKLSIDICYNNIKSVFKVLINDQFLISNYLSSSGPCPIQCLGQLTESWSQTLTGKGPELTLKSKIHNTPTEMKILKASFQIFWVFISTFSVAIVQRSP